MNHLPLILSHRGDRRWAPENTLEAFAHALDSGVDGVETDVRLSRDGKPVLFHDRLAPGGVPVADRTHAELEAAVGFPVPTAAEALRRWPDAFWNLELKVPEALEPVLDALEATPADAPRLVTSFLHDAIAALASRDAVDCGVLLAHRPRDAAGFLADWARLARVTTVCLDVGVVDQAVVDHAHERGLCLFVYNALTPADHDLARRLGADGVITDCHGEGNP